MDGDGNDGDDDGGGVVAEAEQGAAGDSSSRLFFPSSHSAPLSASPYPALIRRLHSPSGRHSRQTGRRETYNYLTNLST